MVEYGLVGGFETVPTIIHLTVDYDADGTVAGLTVVNAIRSSWFDSSVQIHMYAGFGLNPSAFVMFYGIAWFETNADGTKKQTGYIDQGLDSCLTFVTHSNVWEGYAAGNISFKIILDDTTTVDAIADLDEVTDVDGFETACYVQVQLVASQD